MERKFYTFKNQIFDIKLSYVRNFTAHSTVKLELDKIRCLSLREQELEEATLSHPFDLHLKKVQHLLE